MWRLSHQRLFEKFWGSHTPNLGYRIYFSPRGRLKSRLDSRRWQPLIAQKRLLLSRRKRLKWQVPSRIRRISTYSAGSCYFRRSEFRTQAFFILRIGCSLLPCEWIWNFIGKVVVVKGVCMLCVCHEGGVIGWAEEFPVSSKGLSFGLQFLSFGCQL